MADQFIFRDDDATLLPDERQANRILLLENTQLCARNLAMALQQDGYDLVLPSTVEEARAIVRRIGFSAAVISGDLPADALGPLIRDLHSDSQEGFQGAILTLDQERKGFDAFLDRYGLHHVLYKPIPTEGLLSAVNQIFEPMPVRSQAVTLVHPSGKGVEAHIRSTSNGQLALELEPYQQALSFHPGDWLTVEFRAIDFALIQYEARVRAQANHTIELGELRLIGRESRRKAFRRPLQFTVRYRLQGDHSRLAVSRDLSLGGVRLSGVSGRAQIGLPIMLSLMLAPRVSLDVEGTVQHIQDGDEGPEWGVGFDLLGDTLQERLLTLLFGARQNWALLPGRVPRMADLRQAHHS